LEVTAAAAPGPKVFQLYVDGDRAWVRDILSRVKESGYDALCVTADVAIYSKRERTLLSRWVSPSRTNPARNRDYRAALTWEQLDEIKEFAGMPFMVKGIATAEDARLAVEHGVDVVWVSNHGGRQLDHGLGSVEVLPEVLEAVEGKAEVIMDGGVTRGTDIIKALALGAKAVAIGKMHAMGLAAGGSEALVRVLQIFEEEMMVSMGLLGVTNVSQITKNYIREAHFTTLPHEMSAWVNIPGERIL
jgi:glycolate oxidase